MILVLADGTDAWSSRIHRELSSRGEDVVWVQPDQLLDRIQLNWSVKCDESVPDGSLVIEDRSVSLADLTGVLARLPFPLPLLLDDLSMEDRSYVARETTAAWLALLNALPCAVINRPVPGGRPTSLSCSVEHARFAQQHGFLLLPSHCTRSRSDTITQLFKWQGKAYVKPLGSQEPGMILDGHCDVPFDEHLSVLMQPVPAGQRVTVYIAGEAEGTIVHPDGNLNATSVISPLPTEPCARLTRDFGLAFAQCELVLTGDRIYCLDVSASPNYWQCPQEIQQRVVRSLADYLSQPKSIPVHDSPAGAHGRFGSC
jgi:hypothetical protein